MPKFKVDFPYYHRNHISVIDGCGVVEPTKDGEIYAMPLTFADGICSTLRIIKRDGVHGFEARLGWVMTCCGLDTDPLFGPICSCAEPTFAGVRLNPEIVHEFRGEFRDVEMGDTLRTADGLIIDLPYLSEVLHKSKTQQTELIHIFEDSLVHNYLFYKTHPWMVQ